MPSASARPQPVAAVEQQSGTFLHLDRLLLLVGRDARLEPLIPLVGEIGKADGIGMRLVLRIDMHDKAPKNDPPLSRSDQVLGARVGDSPAAPDGHSRANRVAPLSPHVRFPTAGPGGRSPPLLLNDPWRSFVRPVSGRAHASAEDRNTALSCQVA